MKKYLIILLIVIIITPACARVTEVDGKAFVTAIGFDKGENYKLRFTFVFTSPSKSGSNSNSEEKDETIIVEAPSLYSAIEQINNFESKTIELTHTQTIIFSEELAKEGLNEYIYMLVRSSHFRPNTYVCIADKSSMEFLEKIKPVQTYHLEKYFQLLFDKMTSGTRGDMYLYDLYFRLLSESNCGLLPYCAINITELKKGEDKERDSFIPEASTEENSSEPTSEPETIGGEFAANTDDFAINTIAGGNITKSENRAEIQGLAILKDGVLISVLGRRETTGLQMITNSLPQVYLTLSDPMFPDKMITCFVSQKEKPEIKVDCNNNPIISINIKLEGDFSEVGENSEYIRNPEIFEEYFEEKITEDITKLLMKTTKELNCDVFGFSEAAKTSFLTVQSWKDYNWKERFKNSEYKVKVSVTMRTYGELSRKG